MDRPSSALTRPSRRAVLFAAPGLCAATSSCAPAGLPARSDVSFSPRFGYDSHADPLPIAAAFHATRIDWTYGSEPFIAAARRAGYSASAALAPIIGPKGFMEDRVRDAAGRPVAAPWQRGGSVYWGCFNQPLFRDYAVRRARGALAAGAAGIQMDDAMGNLATVPWGGCWCAACRKKAAAQRLDLRTNMLSFQRQSVADFYADFRAGIGSNVPISCNNYGLQWSFPYSLFTFGMAEVSAGQLTQSFLFKALSQTEAKGKRQIVTLRTEEVRLNQRAIAAVYAMGGLMTVPWDVYLGADPKGSKRHFGRPENYAGLYRFVRSQAGWLDDFELLAARGRDISLRPDLIRVQGADGDLLVLRSAPDGRLALHCVPWGRPGPRSVSVKTRRGGARLAMPDGVRALPGNNREGWLTFDLPAIETWAMVLI